MASAYAEDIGAMYLETSAKDDLNVQDIFVRLSKTLNSNSFELFTQNIPSGQRLPAPVQADSNIIKGNSPSLRTRPPQAPKSSCC